MQIKLFVISALLTVLNLFQLEQPAKGTHERGRKEANGNAGVICVQKCSAGTELTLTLTCITSDSPELPLLLRVHKNGLSKSSLLMIM